MSLIFATTNLLTFHPLFHFKCTRAPRHSFAQRKNQVNAQNYFKMIYKNVSLKSIFRHKLIPFSLPQSQGFLLLLRSQRAVPATQTERCQWALSSFSICKSLLITAELYLIELMASSMREPTLDLIPPKPTKAS